MTPQPGPDGTYVRGTVVLLTVIRSAGYSSEVKGFGCPPDDGLDTQFCSIPMAGSVSLAVTFVEAPPIVVINGVQVGANQKTVGVPGGFVGLSRAPGTNGQYGEADEVQIRAEAAPGYVFRGFTAATPRWSMSSDSGGEAYFVGWAGFTRTTRVTAQFDFVGHVLRLNDAVVTSEFASIGHAGSVKVNPPPDQGSAGYPVGTRVTLAFDPAYVSRSWTFNGWRGDCSGTGECTVFMNSDRSVTGNFTRHFEFNGWVTVEGCAWRFDEKRNAQVALVLQYESFPTVDLRTTRETSFEVHASGGIPGCSLDAKGLLLRVSDTSWRLTLTTKLIITPPPKKTPDIPPISGSASLTFGSAGNYIAIVGCRVEAPDTSVWWRSQAFAELSPVETGTLQCASGSVPHGESNAGFIAVNDLGDARSFGTDAKSEAWWNQPGRADKVQAIETKTIEFSIEWPELDLGQTCSPRSGAPVPGRCTSWLPEEEAAGAFVAGIEPGTPEFDALFDLRPVGPWGQLEFLEGVNPHPIPGRDPSLLADGGAFVPETPILMVKRLYDRLLKLRIWAAADGLGQPVVVEAWSEDYQHGLSRLHQEGRAADVVLNDRDPDKLGRLAQLAVYADFDWVWFDGAVVHVAVRRD